MARFTRDSITLDSLSPNLAKPQLLPLNASTQAKNLFGQPLVVSRILFRFWIANFPESQGELRESNAQCGTAWPAAPV
jgi:hypothetical protein